MTDILDELHDVGLIADIDRHFARLVTKFDTNPEPDVALGAALASFRTRAGHVCLELARFAEGPIKAVFDSAEKTAVEVPGYDLPALDAWRSSLLGSKVVAGPGCESERPLVLDDEDRLYLARYRDAERDVARLFLGLSAATEPIGGVEEAMGRLFEPDDEERRRAAKTVLGHRLCVVTGGPGTGKTTLAARLIALLLDLRLVRPNRIALAAPTGKAAARLQEAVAAQVQGLKAKVPVLSEYEAIATTVHRMLIRRGTGLVLDLVILDEASMVDLSLMSRLLNALPENARLVVLGDASQLASVQPGAVLGDLCDAAEQTDSLLGECNVKLTRSHRFRPDGGIGGLARAIVAGDSAAVLHALADESDPETKLRSLSTVAAFERFAGRYAVESAEPCLRHLRESPMEMSPFPSTRVLCAHRHGPFGANRFNRLVEDRLRQRGLASRGEVFYPGRPIIVTRNDPATKLSNGDTGVVVVLDGSPRVWFPELDRGQERFLVSPARLPDHESFFALTVHKAQGSEYEEVAFIPGPADSRVATRELFYTAVTRARTKVSVYGDEAGVAAATERSTRRVGGLASRLLLTG